MYAFAFKLTVSRGKPAGPLCTLVRRELIFRGRQFGSAPRTGDEGGSPVPATRRDHSKKTARSSALDNDPRSGGHGMGVDQGLGEVDQFGFPRVPFS